MEGFAATNGNNLLHNCISRLAKIQKRFFVKLTSYY
jgi:hypothetical protein